MYVTPVFIPCFRFLVSDDTDACTILIQFLKGDCPNGEECQETGGIAKCVYVLRMRSLTWFKR